MSDILKDLIEESEKNGRRTLLLEMIRNSEPEEKLLLYFSKEEYESATAELLAKV